MLGLAPARLAALACAALLLVLPAASPPAATASAGQAKSIKKHRGKRAKMRSAPRPAYWGAWIGDQLTGTQPPWDMSAVARFESLVGKGLSLLQFSSPFAKCDGSRCFYYSFPTEQMQDIRDYGAIPVLSWNSSGSPAALEDPDFQFADIVGGAHDRHIRQFAEAARDWGHPFFLRFNWEMNGDWFAWSEGVNGNQSGEFNAAWRHVHDIFAAVGATNASWMWCPYADPHRKFSRLGALYPGDEYVDWTCMDGYNWARNPTNPHPWRSFETIFRSTYRQIVRRIAPHKPMMLAEVASTGNGRAKAAWIDNMFRAIRTRYKRIRGLIWFDKVDRGIDWPLESAPRAARAFARGIGHRAFSGNGQASISTTPIPPPG